MMIVKMQHNTAWNFSNLCRYVWNNIVGTKKLSKNYKKVTDVSTKKVTDEGTYRKFISYSWYKKVTMQVWKGYRKVTDVDNWKF